MKNTKKVTPQKANVASQDKAAVGYELDGTIIGYPDPNTKDWYVYIF